MQGNDCNYFIANLPCGLCTACTSTRFSFLISRPNRRYSNYSLEIFTKTRWHFQKKSMLLLGTRAFRHLRILNKNVFNRKITLASISNQFDRFFEQQPWHFCLHSWKFANDACMRGASRTTAKRNYQKKKIESTSASSHAGSVYIIMFGATAIFLLRIHTKIFSILQICSPQIILDIPRTPNRLC